MAVVVEALEKAQSSEEVDSEIVASDTDSCADKSESSAGDTVPEELCGSDSANDAPAAKIRVKTTSRARSQVGLERRSKGRSGAVRRAATSPVLEDPVARAQQRVQQQFAARRQAKQEERRQKALGQCRYDAVNLEAFRRATAARLAKEKEAGQELSEESMEPRELAVGNGTFDRHGGAERATSKSKQRRRIAIVGAGPVGLWAANLIMLRHARRVRRPVAGSGATAARAAPVFIRSKDAPEIVIFEQRAEQDHCSRRNVRITLDAHTVACLNQHGRKGQ